MTIAIIGAAGFIGKHLVTHLLASGVTQLVLVSRRHPDGRSADDPRLAYRRADLADVTSLTAALTEADVVVNLAWPGGSTVPTIWCEALARAVLARDARHLVHCSTAVVVGRTPARVVTEGTAPRPVMAYERQKWQAEQLLTSHLRGRAPLTVARPTAVFGPGGYNLVALADALRRGGAVRGALRRMLFGDRAMHLVPVGTVVRALRFLASRTPTADGALFHVAADEDPENTYRCVEGRLTTGLGIPQAAWPPLTLPATVLSMALRARGRSDTSADRCYSGVALRAAGFVDACPVGTAVEDFGRWYAAEGHRR